MPPPFLLVSPEDRGGALPSPPSSADLETLVIKSIAEDDKAGLLAVTRELQVSAADRPAVSKLLHLCCSFEAADCAAALLNGDVSGVVPLVNEFDEDSRLAPLHEAARALSARCVEVLLKKHARTDLKSRDERFLIPLELSLASARAEVRWTPEQDGSIEELVTQLCRKDLRAVKLLCEKTSTLDEVAYAAAIGGRVVDLAALLLVAAEAVTGAVLELHDTKSETKEKTTLYECVIREALSLGPSSSKTAPPLRSAKRNSAPTKGEIEERRKLLLLQIELLQLFGAVSRGVCTDKKVVSPLIRAAQARDEAVVDLLLKTSIDINDVDADGNSALHWCLKTAKGSCPHHRKIMRLLLEHGARVGQKNKVGMTAAHFAAANGNLEGLQIVLLHEPDSTNAKTEIKETPLFFAVKNDHKDCAELLLLSGACTEVLNLRRQRPIDFALSQDMRVLLNPISLTNLSLPVKKKHIALLQGDEIISETRKDVSCLTNEEDNSDRSSNTETEVCKYFESPSGCIRGKKCFYLHSQERQPKTKQAKEIVYCPALRDSERKVFVGGLPPSVDSETLRVIFEEQFGSVDNAIVVGIPTGNEIQSRGFGFITFKDKISVSAAIELHYITVMGKRVEIKSAVPKWMLQQSEQHVPEEEALRWRITMMSSGKNMIEKNEKGLFNQPRKETLCDILEDEAEAEPRPWIDKLKHGHPEAGSKEMLFGTPPPWLRTFKKWFPHFLQKMYKRDGEYALSSLKADFRSAFGLELDHTAIGFLKLSDFMRSFPELCQVELAPIDRKKTANHMILVPVHPKIKVSLKDVTGLSPSPAVTPGSPSPAVTPGSPLPAVTSISGKCSDDTEHLKDLHVSPNGNQDSTGGFPAASHENSRDGRATSPSLQSRFLQFLRPDPIFHDRTWRHEESSDSTRENGAGERRMKQSETCHQERHLVLEAMTRAKSRGFSFFTREFDFDMNYRASLLKGTCIGCDQLPMLCANFPCLHLLWCSACALQAIQASGCSEHKCVICDKKVEHLVTAPRHGKYQPIALNNFCLDYQLFDPRYNIRRESFLQQY